MEGDGDRGGAFIAAKSETGDGKSEGAHIFLFGLVGLGATGNYHYAEDSNNTYDLIHVFRVLEYKSK
jgi:hypothetical protein